MEIASFQSQFLFFFAYCHILPNNHARRLQMPQLIPDCDLENNQHKMITGNDG